MRDDGLRIGLRQHDYEAAVEIVTDRDEETGDFSLWLYIVTAPGDDEEEEALAVELSPEEARALSGGLKRMADHLGRHIEWVGLSSPG